MSENGAECSSCAFCKQDGGGSSPLVTVCRRYPESVAVAPEHWCGEYKRMVRFEDVLDLIALAREG